MPDMPNIANDGQTRRPTSEEADRKVSQPLLIRVGAALRWLWRHRAPGLKVMKPGIEFTS